MSTLEIIGVVIGGWLGLDVLVALVYSLHRTYEKRKIRKLYESQALDPIRGQSGIFITDRRISP